MRKGYWIWTAALLGLLLTLVLIGCKREEETEQKWPWNEQESQNGWIKETWWTPDPDRDPGNGGNHGGGGSAVTDGKGDTRVPTEPATEPVIEHEPDTAVETEPAAESAIGHETRPAPQPEETQPAGPVLTEQTIQRMVADSTVIVYATGNGGESVGNGFYIDEYGTLVTMFSVISGAEDIEIYDPHLGRVPVSSVVTVLPAYDLAVLRVEMTESCAYLPICEDPDSVQVSDTVYTAGWAYESEVVLAAGTITETDCEYGAIAFFQSNATVLEYSGGGPLLNTHGEVIGINMAGTYEDGPVVYSAKISTLEELGASTDWTVAEFAEWQSAEWDRSYRIWDQSDDSYYYTMIHAYHSVTGVECLRSSTLEDSGSRLDVDGYLPGMEYYYYPYSVPEINRYTSYLNSQGFCWGGAEDGWYCQVNDYNGMKLMMFHEEDSDLLCISFCFTE